MHDQVTDTVTDKPEEVEVVEPARTRRGRPKKNIDLEAVFKMASVGCVMREISFILDIHEDTIKRREDCREAYDRGVENSKVRLRKAMFTNAIDKMVPSVQIFLSKNILGMSDQGSHDTDGDNILPWKD